MISSDIPVRPATVPERKGQVALRLFFGIAKEWGLSAGQQQALLGGVSRSTLHNYQKTPEVRLPRDLMERISYISGIYKALRILFTTPDRANAWVKRPNSAVPFLGETAEDFMARGSIMHLAEVRRYLDAQRGW